MKLLIKKIRLGVIALFPLLLGCSNEEDSINVKFLTATIQYVDKDGNLLIEETDVEILAKTSPLEVLSVTNGKGDSIEFNSLGYPKVAYTKPRIIIDKGFTDLTSPKEREYIIKYKIPTVLGESIEELRLIYKVDINSYTDVWYNNKKIIRFVTPDAICAECRDPQFEFNIEQEEYQRKVKELLYNGDTVAYLEETSIYLILPIE